MIYLGNLTYYTWYLLDNFIVHVTIVVGKILLHGNNTLLLYLLHILLYWYLDHMLMLLSWLSLSYPSDLGSMYIK